MSALRQIATEPANLDLKAVETMERSPHLKQKTKSQGGVSDSDISTETNSLSADSNADNGKSPLKNSSTALEVQPGKGKRRRGTDWEIIGSSKSEEVSDKQPAKLEGYLLKKRKWPLKGWHKRYFILDKGCLIYGKRPIDLTRGKIHGSVDLGLSVISAKKRRCRIDIDAEVFIYHIKIKSNEVFSQWMDSLKEHYHYRQQQLKGNRDGVQKITSPLVTPSLVEEPSSTTIHVCNSLATDTLGPVSREGSLLRTIKPSRAAMIINESSSALEQLSGELTAVEDKLSTLIKSAEACVSSDSHSTTDTISPITKKERKKFGLRRKKNKSHSSTSETTTSASVSESESGAGHNLLMDKHSPLSSSIPSLSPLINGSVSCELAPPIDNGGGCSPGEPSHEFLSGSREVITRFKAILRALNHERERLKLAVEAVTETQSVSSRNGTGTGHGPSMVASLRSALQVVLQQNSELRARLQRIRAETDPVCDGLNLTLSLDLDLNATQRLEHQSLSYSSSCVSQSEFFDAKEYLTDVAGSDSSSDGSEAELELEAEEEGSISEASEIGNELPLDIESPELISKCNTGRRTKLPVPKPSTEDLSLWNLLRRNIGKDLSKVSMPVVLNEPIGMLQRLCEELEYSELLDKAAETDDAYERMVLIAAFAVSAYGSSHFRAGHKPFNPLLGETYECVREDKGFKYIAEQVSHHPPISVCHASSSNFEFWQDIRIKTKFWGKSMEFQPLGTVNVRIFKFDEDYTWNKITTCVHNLFGGQRWVDQYGELLITNTTRNIQCKLNFVKASYWSTNRHEVVGSVVDSQGKTVHHLFGKWSEGLYCGVAPSARCIWRPGALPEDHELYYGFSRFAIELNDLEQHLIGILPPTDSRFRPDQRLLEEGNVTAAETAKLQLEQAQRERRIIMERDGITHQPKWFRKFIQPNGEEKWEFTGSYWDTRSKSKFSDMEIQRLW